MADPQNIAVLGRSRKSGANTQHFNLNRSVPRFAADHTLRLSEDGLVRMTAGVIWVSAVAKVARLAADGTARLSQDGHPRFSEGY